MAGELAQGLILLRGKFNQSGGISRHCIHLEVDPVSNFCLPPSRDFLGMFDQQHVKIPSVDLINGQRCAVKRHGTFGSDEFGEFGWCPQCIARRLSFRFDGDDFSTSVYMARNDVSAQFVTDLQSPLKIDCSSC